MLALVLVSPGLAGASTQDEFENTPDAWHECGTVQQVLARSGGETVAAADCETAGGTPVTVLVQLNRDGSVDRSFADGGVRTLPPGLDEPVEMIDAENGSLFVIMQNALLKFDADGVPEGSFGEDGVVAPIAELVPGATSISSAALSGGELTVVTTSADQPVIARIDSDGTPDETFAGDGTAEPVVPAELGEFSLETSAVAVDPSGRTVVIGGDIEGAIALRLLGDGAPDPAFGASGTGFSRGPVLVNDNTFYFTQAAYVNDDGSIRAYGQSAVGAWRFRFDADGQPLTSYPQKLGKDFGNLVEVMNGGVAGTVANVFPFGFGTPVFGLKIWNYLQPFYARSAELPPYYGKRPGSKATALSYDPETRELAAGGFTDSFGTRSLVIARSDAATGEPVAAFGGGGMVLLPGNECPYGLASPPEGHKRAWNRCRVASPKIEDSSIRFKRVRTARPVIEGRVRMGDIPEPQYMTNNRQVLSIRLPKRLRFRPEAVGRIKVEAIVRREDSTTWRAALSELTSAGVKGRTLTVTMTGSTSWFSTATSPASPIYSGEGSLGIRFRVKRGALNPIPRGLRTRRLNFPVTARVDPIKRLYEGGYEPSTFLGENGTARVLKVRPTKRP